MGWQTGRESSGGRNTNEQSSNHRVEELLFNRMWNRLSILKARQVGRAGAKFTLEYLHHTPYPAEAALTKDDLYNEAGQNVVQDAIDDIITATNNVKTSVKDIIECSGRRSSSTKLSPAATQATLATGSAYTTQLSLSTTSLLLSELTSATGCRETERESGRRIVTGGVGTIWTPGGEEQAATGHSRTKMSGIS